MSLGRTTPISPAAIAAPMRGYYSNAVRVSAGPLLFIAGQLSVDAHGALVGAGDAAAQAEQIMSILAKIMAAGGGTLADICKLTVYVTDMAVLDLIAPVRMAHFPKDGPASTIVEVARLALPGALIEIDAIAAVV